MTTNTDVVVVGGGSAGCVIAARLTENPDLDVVLVEAGGATGPAEMALPPAWPMLLGGPADWGYTTSAQPGLGGARVPYPRGRVLGGSSAINAMAHLRGHRDDYDAWAAADAKTWGYADLLPYFRRSEDAPGRDQRYRGVGGPMRVSPAASPHPVALAGLDAVTELGFGCSEDLNGAGQEGGGWLEMNAVDGVRQSAYDAYLKPCLGRPNLRIVTRAQVQSLVVADGPCRGVDYVDSTGAHRVGAATEVVLCAGTIGSPQLLLHSGIGPAAELRRLGIDVLVDSPGVGRNLQDHPLAGVIYSANGPMPEGVNNHAAATALLRSGADAGRPDVQLLFMDVPFHPPALTGPPVGYTVAFALLRPNSKGSVTLASADPSAPPVIDPGFYTDDRDLDAMAAGLRLARRLGATDALSRWRGREVLPGPAAADQDEDALHDYLRQGTGTYFHPVGTCRLGSDPDAVVDVELRFNGLTGLRIADASVLPSLVSANTNATVLAIAERAAEWIRT